MDLKKKFKSFITDIRESTGKTPEEEHAPFDISELVVSPAVAKFKDHLTDQPIDPVAEQEIVNSISTEYYNDQTFDIACYELQKLPDEETIDLTKVEDEIEKMQKQLRVVSKRVAEMVLENHPAYAAELQKVMELQQALQNASIVCANGRRQLGEARRRFTVASLRLLANYRKRQQLVGLLKSLKTIKTLQRTDIRLREMVEEEDYPRAIQLCLECQKAASTFKHYHCISELSSKLQDTLEMIEESLDVALSRTAASFDEEHYSKVQLAYQLLGKTQTAMDQLHMHFTSAIHNTAFTIVLGFVELVSGTGDTNFQKRQYTELCKHISTDIFTPCLIDLCKALWEIMKSYHRTIEWHDKHEQMKNMEKSQNDTQQNGSSCNDVESSVNQRYVEQKLKHGCARIWGDIQQKLKVYLLSTDLSYFKYDEFIQVLDIINRLIEIGEEFCDSKSEALQESLRRQSINYFRTYHWSRMDELQMFLENEGWDLCPVKTNFSILQLQDFKFLRGQQSQSSTGENILCVPTAGSDQKTQYFHKYNKSITPFDQEKDEEEQEDVLDTNGYGGDKDGLSLQADVDSDDDIPDELKQDFIDELTGETPPNKKPLRRKRSIKGGGKPAPIITNTTLNVCRLFGKYMQMMNVLKPIAFDVIICMSQLFDYYLYAVYSFFATDLDMNEVNERSLSSKLRTTLKRIEDNLIVFPDDTSASVPSEEQEHRDKIPHPHLSSVVQLDGLDRLHGLPARLVATESLIFLAEQFDFLQSSLEAMIPPAKKAFLQQFYSQTVSTARELRKPVYRTVTAKSINYENLLQQMSAVKWDIKDIMSQHSTYVDVLLQEMKVFNMRLGEVSRIVPIPEVVSNVLWEHSIRLANRTLVEGYAGAKKCSNEGRALMQLDFQQFLLKLEKLTTLRPIPDREYVEGYVKAYYLPEAQLEEWIKDHKHYTSKQLFSLVTCMVHINKKARQRLITVIEDVEKCRR